MLVRVEMKDRVIDGGDEGETTADEVDVDCIPVLAAEVNE